MGASQGPGWLPYTFTSLVAESKRQTSFGDNFETDSDIGSLLNMHLEDERNPFLFTGLVLTQGENIMNQNFWS